MKKSLMTLCAAILIAAAFGGTAAAEPKTNASPMSDSWITAKTKMALASDDRVKGRQVNVETKNAAVMLRGKVDTEEAKLAAEEVAKNIENVKSVKNELQVVAPARREAVDDNDDAISERVAKALDKDDSLRKADIDVTVNAGVVTLTGDAPDMMSKGKASWLAWKMPGVKSVTNDLVVKEKAKTAR